MTLSSYLRGEITHWKIYFILILDLIWSFKNDFYICNFNPILILTHWRKMLSENIIEKGEIAHFEQFHLFP